MPPPHVRIRRTAARSRPPAVRMTPFARRTVTDATSTAAARRATATNARANMTNAGPTTTAARIPATDTATLEQAKVRPPWRVGSEPAQTPATIEEQMFVAHAHVEVLTLRIVEQVRQHHKREVVGERQFQGK